MTASESSTSDRQPRKAWDKRRTERLFRRYKENGDMEAREQLIENHSNLVHFLANKYANKGQPIEDLVQVGQMGLIKAVDGFDPSRGLQFTTYATPTILGEIRRYFRDKAWSMRVPRSLKDLSLKVNDAVATLTRENSISPSVQEVASYLGESVDDVLEAMEASRAYSATPLEASTGEDEDGPTLLDKIDVDDRSISEADNRMLLEEVLRDCPPREREILQMRFEEGLTQSQIAERLDVSQVQVSRLLRRTIQKLQGLMGTEGGTTQA